MKTELLVSKKSIKLSPAEDTQYVLLPKGKVFVEVLLDKEGISVELLILLSLKDKEEIRLSTQSAHKVPNTNCMVSVKGVLFDAAKSEYVGKILIEKGAQQTVSFLEDNMLSVGSKTKNHSQPILEIEANDVKASHGATTGRVSEDQIYYLMSRGLTRKDAEKTVIEGFFEAVISQITDEKVRTKVRKELNA